ncbi:hypothetical protein, partial [Mycolicibacterium hippocampi]
MRLAMQDILVREFGGTS